MRSSVRSLCPEGLILSVSTRQAGQGHNGLVFLELLLSQGCMNSSPGFGPGRCESGWPIMV